MAKKFDLEAYKKTIKVAEVPLKKDKFIKVDECLQAVIGMEGIPLGHVTQVYGKSDVGKTTLMFHAAIEAQKQGILPILIITEGKISHQRLADMGFDKENAIMEENLEYLEDVFNFIDKTLADQEKGDLPVDICFFWDSVGNTLSKDEFETQKDGSVVQKATMMKAAKVITNFMRNISKRINNTRKVPYPKYAGLFILNQAYTKPPTFTGGMSSLVPYGGDAIYYRSSLVLKMNRKNKLIAKKDGKTLGFGITSKISVEKNHITNVSHSGEFVITAKAIIPNDKTAVDNYKKDNRDDWGDIVVSDSSPDFEPSE